MSKVAFTLKLEKANAYDMVRHTWAIRPTTRVVASKKSYSRRNGKQEVRAIMRGEY